MVNKGGNVLGSWTFLIGVILALIVGALGLVSAQWTATLVVLGIVIGLLNVGGSELKDFMLAGTVLVIVSAFGGQGLAGLDISVIRVGAILNALVTLFVPATIVVALKVVLALGKK